jgi:hypothetical protein
MDVVIALAEEQPMNSSAMHIEDAPPPLASAYEKPEKLMAIQEKISRYVKDVNDSEYDRANEPSCSSA